MKRNTYTKEEKRLAFALLGGILTVIVASCFILGGYGLMISAIAILGALSY